MSSFHTKSIERILSPVAQQVGYDTIDASDDDILRRDMPPSLKRVEDASIYLQEAVVLLQKNSASPEARKYLIEGSRGILQGTSSVLLTFDMSEVRKIIVYCRKVLEVLATTDDVGSFARLADFVKRLTPCMTHMIKEVDNRQEELTIQSHAALLRRGIEQLRRLTPILVSSLKLYINTQQNSESFSTFQIVKLLMSRRLIFKFYHSFLIFLWQYVICDHRSFTSNLLANLPLWHPTRS
ncbi:Vinculin [Fasciola hepatica]|uniref:Vinculin n=1 Tax=Fasciola hepatica TaxID=6192 RepID=A0A4E0RLR6_FASHE|nr:Vinculin [Fasciola hepatica]